MRDHTVFRRLLGFTGVVVEDLRFDEKGLTVDVLPRARRPRCGRCSRRAPGYDVRPARLWRHLSWGSTKVWLRYAPRRVECGHCGVVIERVPWAAHGSRFTLPFEEMVAYLAQGADFTRVRAQMGIAWSSVGEIVERVVARQLDPGRFDGLKRIGIDEFSYRRRHRYLTIVVDHDRRRIVWAKEGHTSDTLFSFFELLGPDRCAEIRCITVDLAKPWRLPIRMCLPKATVVYDRFHVQRLASDALDGVRRTLLHDLRGTEEGDKLFGARFALLKRAENLRPAEKETLRSLEKLNAPLYRAYLLKEALVDVFETDCPATAPTKLRRWLAWAMRSKLKPFQKAAKTIKRHFDGIIAYVREKLTNGLVEGFNTRLRMITRRAFGFHGPDPLISMLYLNCGGIQLAPPLPSPT